MIKSNVTNTIMNVYKDYLQKKACGIQVQKIYIEKVVNFEETEEQKAGKWFEFKVIGTLNRDGSEPQPVVTAAKGVPAAITKHLTGQIENFNNIYADVKIEETSKVLEIELEGYKFKGILDVLASNKLDGIHIRDIKVTGHLDNKWDSYGWEMLLGNGQFLPEKSHINQAKFYAWLWFELTGEIPVFYFDVFSNKNEKSCSIKRLRFSDEAISFFKSNLLETTKQLDKELEKGLKAIPSMDKCCKCPIELSENCKFKVYTPEVEEYFIN